MGRRVDALVNAVRAAVERVVPWYDPEAEDRRRASASLSLRVAARNRIRADAVIGDYRRAAGPLRR